jgi:hypothetical protein
MDVDGEDLQRQARAALGNGEPFAAKMALET